MRTSRSSQVSGMNPQCGLAQPRAGYTAEELQRFFAACTREHCVRFEFFLGTGFREKEVPYVMWKDISLSDHNRVTLELDSALWNLFS